jgi:hypothetical protein
MPDHEVIAALQAWIGGARSVIAALANWLETDIESAADSDDVRARRVQVDRVHARLDRLVESLPDADDKAQAAAINAAIRRYGY